MPRGYEIAFIVHLYLHFMWGCLRGFFSPNYLSGISNTNNLHTVAWFQVFLSNTNDYMVSRNNFYLIIVIFFNSYIFK